MFALFLTGLFLATAVVVAGVLADSGLRWWSAFGALRRELKGDSAPHLPALRPAASYVCGSRQVPARSCAQPVSRAA